MDSEAAKPMEARPDTPATGPVPTPTVGHPDGREAADRPAVPGRRRISRPIVLAIGAVVLIALAAVGYRFWYTATHFVWTDNAQVSGPIIQVGALNAGEVTAVYTDVGQHVEKGQVIARVSIPMPVAAATGGTAKLGFTNTENQLVDVTAPISGVVVARLADPGSTVAPGQPIIALIDPTRLSVTANVNETDIARVHVGQAVDVSLDSLGVVLPGRVEAVTPASAGSFSLIPPQNASGNYTKVVQVVPVKIAVAYGNLPLIVGSSVEVNIHVR